MILEAPLKYRKLSQSRKAIGKFDIVYALKQTITILSCLSNLIFSLLLYISRKETSTVAPAIATEPLLVLSNNAKIRNIDSENNTLLFMFR